MRTAHEWGVLYHPNDEAGVFCAIEGLRPELPTPTHTD